MAQHLIEQEENFNILKNVSGDLMVLMRARMENAHEPRIVYDGGEHALLYRNENNTVILDYIHPQIRNDLAHAEGVLVVEAQGQSIIREYVVPVKIMKKIPLPKGIKEPE